jgi:Flp pilus assembly protein TadD
LLQLGRREEGIAQIQNALQVDPKATRALENLGLIELEEGKVDDAVRLLSQAAELRPEDGVTRVNLAKALLAGGDVKGAEAALVEAVRLAPDSAVAHARLALLLVESGRAGEAASHLERALDLDPRDASIRVVAGQVALRQGDVEGALGHYRLAHEAAPEDREAALGLAAALRRSGQSGEAAPLLDRIALQTPEASDVIRLAEVAFHGLDQVTGVGLLRAAVHARPADPDLRFALGRVLAGSGQSAEAVEHYREALRLRPGWGDAANSLALLLATADERRVRDPAEAVRLARELAAASGNRHPVLLGTLGVALAADGRRREAEEVLSRAVATARSAGQEALAGHLERYLEQVRQGWPPPPSR